jgi:RNA-binding protein YlmH
MACRCDDISKYERDINKIEDRLYSLRSAQTKLSKLKGTRSRLVTYEQKAYVVSSLRERTILNKSRNRSRRLDKALTYAQKVLSNHQTSLKSSLTVLKVEDKTFHES